MIVRRTAAVLALGLALGLALVGCSDDDGSGPGTTTTAAAAERGRANELFNACQAAEASCPTLQLAIVLDGEVISAPTVQSPDLADDEFVINGGTAGGGFIQDDAEDLVARIQGG